MKAHSSPRGRAFSILKSILIEGHAFSPSLETPWVKALCFGVLRQKFSLDYILDPSLKEPPSPKQNALRILLYMGAYQILFMDLKTHAALFETVELAKTLHLPHAFVNAVLRNIQRQGKALLNTIPPFIQFNHPDWLIRLLQAQYPEIWPSILNANNLPPPFFIRVNQRKIKRDDYLLLLEEKGIQAEISLLSPDGLFLPVPVSVELLPHFESGFSSVQDLAAQLAPYILQPQCDQVVLDACAAPGGKACHLLEYQNLTLHCIDHKENRSLNLQSNLKRLNLSAEISIADSSCFAFPPHFFDCILVDAPCSGTGVIRRHPDIRYLKFEHDLPALAEMQKKILNNVWPALKPGGKLLYATCSILEAENDAVIQKFLATHPEACAEPVSFSEGQASLYGWQFLPSVQGPDGFYYSLLRKQK